MVKSGSQNGTSSGIQKWSLFCCKFWTLIFIIELLLLSPGRQLPGPAGQSNGGKYLSSASLAGKLPQRKSSPRKPFRKPLGNLSVNGILEKTFKPQPQGRPARLAEVLWPAVVADGFAAVAAVAVNAVGAGPVWSCMCVPNALPVHSGRALCAQPAFGGWSGLVPHVFSGLF